MKKLCIIGTGYVGLPLAAAFANVGNEVTCLDLDENKIQQLQEGKIPIYEPGLEELIKRNTQNFIFTTNVEQAIQNNDILFVCVGTPSCTDGSADLQYVLSVAESIGKHMNSSKIIVDKSTVPIGTADLVTETIQKQLTERKVKYVFHVVSNPEFMREGCAVEDVLHPDRVVIGTDDVPTGLTLKRLYEPFVLNGNPIIITDIRSAEMIKYASNCFLATKISFINEMANICEKVGANVLEVRKGMAADHRIGDKFLYASLGWGGSCFGKDCNALLNISRNISEESLIIKSTIQTNESRPKRFVDTMLSYLLPDKVAIWGLAFKPETDDIRDAASIKVIKLLLSHGITVNVHDPMAIENTQKVFGNKVNYFESQYECLLKVDALLLCTEWGIYRMPNWGLMKKLMFQHYIFDGRNQYNVKEVHDQGFNYISIGREAGII